MTEKEKIAKAPRTRKKRGRIDKDSILSVVGKDPDFEYRIVNDTGDRVARFEDHDWEVVASKSVRIGDKRVGNPSEEGTAAKVHVGRGMSAYLMRIPKEFYAEDQAEKQAEVMRTEQATKQEALDGTYGKLEISRGS